MKILHVINNLGSGGAEKLLEEIVPLLNKKNDVDILLLTNKRNVFKESLIKKYINVSNIKYQNLYDPRNVIEINKYISKGKYDIVHSHLFPTQYWVALSQLFLGSKKVKLITTEHSTHNRRRDRFYFKLIDKFIYYKYDAIISISKETRDNLVSWIDSRHKRLDKHIVVENGVDLEKIRNALPYNKSDLELGISEDTKLICMVGRFSEHKDHSTLIKAMAKLPNDVHLILVGEGPLKDINQKHCKELGIDNRVHFLGFREDVANILKTVEVVVLSSNWEGFGLAALEGMAAHKAVVASNVPGLADVVNGGGILFEKNNSEELYRIINELISNEDYYVKTCNSCINRAQRYDINNMIIKLEELYINI